MVRVSAFDVKESNRCNSGGSSHVIRVVIEFFDMATGAPYRIEYYEIPYKLFSRMRLGTSFPITKSSFNEIDDWVTMSIGISNLSRVLKYKLVTEEKEILSIVNILNKMRSDTLPNSLSGSRSMILNGCSVGRVKGIIYGVYFDNDSIASNVNGQCSMSHFRDVKFF